MINLINNTTKTIMKRTIILG